MAYIPVEANRARHGRRPHDTRRAATAAVPRVTDPVLTMCIEVQERYTVVRYSCIRLRNPPNLGGVCPVLLAPSLLLLLERGAHGGNLAATARMRTG